MLSRCYSKELLSENLKEVLENLDKFKKINFGNRDENGLDAHFSSLENPSYTFAEEVDDKDSETESFHISEAIKNQSEPRDNNLNVKAKIVETDEDVIEKVVDIAQEIVNAEKSVFKAMNLMLLSFLTILFITIPIIKFAVNILMFVLTLLYMHLFVPLPLNAMLNMFLETNTEFMKNVVAQMVKIKGGCCASLSLLTGGERKDGGPYHAEETVTKYMSPTMLDSLNNFLAVNKDFTEMEKPDYLASVDNLTQSTKSCMAWDTDPSQLRLLYQVRILNRLLRFNYLYGGNLLCQCCVVKLFGRLYKN